MDAVAQKTERGRNLSGAEISKIICLRGVENKTYGEIAKELGRGYSTIYRHAKKEGVKRNFPAEREKEILEAWQLFIEGKKLKEIVQEMGLCKRTIRDRIVEHAELRLKEHPDALSGVLDTRKGIEEQYRIAGRNVSDKVAMRSALLHYAGIARREAESVKIEEMIKDNKTIREIGEALKKSSKTIYDRMGESIRRKSSPAAQQDVLWLTFMPLLRY